MAGLSRRRFLRSAAIGALSAGFLAACADDDGAKVRGDPDAAGTDDANALVTEPPPSAAATG